MAIPSLAMIPSGYKDGKVYSVLPTNGDGDFDFSRGSNATRVNKDGLIETVTGDTPRLDYSDSSCPSLLLEPQRTNLITYSEDFSNWISGSTYTTQGYAISPDGTQNASRLLFTGSGQNIYIATSATGDVVGSIYVKGTLGETIQLFVGGGETQFTLNGYWQRIVVEKTSSTNGFINVNTNGGSTARDLLVWGAQLEEGSYATSYIPTNGATATRLADVCNGAGNADTFNDSEGVLYAEISALTLSDGSRGIEISDGNTNRVIIQYNPSGGLQVYVIVNGVQTYTFAYTTLIMQFKKIALKYKENDFALWVDGFEADSSNSGSVFGANTLTQLDFLKAVNSSLNFYGNIKQIQYFNTALTDEELKELTS